MGIFRSLEHELRNLPTFLPECFGTNLSNCNLVFMPAPTSLHLSCTFSAFLLDQETLGCISVNAAAAYPVCDSVWLSLLGFQVSEPDSSWNLLATSFHRSNCVVCVLYCRENKCRPQLCTFNWIVRKQVPWKCFSYFAFKCSTFEICNSALWQNVNQKLTFQ